MDDMSVALKEDKMDQNKMRSYGADQSGPQEQANGLKKEEGTVESLEANPPSGVKESENEDLDHGRNKGKSPCYGNMLRHVIYCPWTKQ